MLSLMRRILMREHHYYAALPYNLNWMLRDLKPVHGFLIDNSISVLDVGARGCAPDELAGLFQYIDYHGFDADKEACDERSERQAERFASFNMAPLVVGAGDGEAEFLLYETRSYSSTLPPGKRYGKNYDDSGLMIDRRIKLKSTTLDRYLGDRDMVSPDFVKIDTQGTEHDILSASPSALAHTSLIQAEMEFTEIYEGQKLAHDLMQLMYEHGFELLYLNRVLTQRKCYRLASRGQLIFGDALFGKREDQLHGWAPARMAKYVILLVNYGHVDLAAQICDQNPSIEEIAPSIRDLFPRGPGSLLKQWVICQMDRLICLMLHARKYNQQTIDSDRSWPAR